MLQPVNNLEKTLHKAAKDHNKASAFYDELMESKIFVLGKPEHEKDDDKLRLDEPYLELSTVDLFQLTIGAPLVLNPNSNLGMEFEPEDIAMLLDSSLMENQKHILDQQTEVLLGHAENISDVFTSVLSAFFKKHSEVRAAYIGTIQIPSDDDNV